jgi:hypothetical protein
MTNNLNMRTGYQEGRREKDHENGGTRIADDEGTIDGGIPDEDI